MKKKGAKMCGRNSRGSNKHSNSSSLVMKPKFQAGKRSSGGKRPKTLFKEVTAMLARAGKRAARTPKRRSYGARGAVKREFHPFSQRVVIKSRIIRTGGRNIRGVLEHVNYLQRDGAGLDRAAPCAFNSEGSINKERVSDWAKDIVEDRHHFRMIISPERGAELDLEQYAKDLMKQMEFNLDTKLEWLGVTHYNTDNPHIHILLRGKDQHKNDLVISRDYISRGARISAEKIATRELGLRTERDIEQEVKRSLTKDRFVPIDRSIERLCSPEFGGQSISLREAPTDRFAAIKRSNMVGRLRHLEGLELAAESAPGIWSLDENWTKKLKALGIRNDIIKSMKHKIHGIEVSHEFEVSSEEGLSRSPLKGRVVDQGLDDELSGSKYLLIEGPDKRSHYVTLPSSFSDEINIGNTVTVSMQTKLLETTHEIKRSLSIQNHSRELGRELGLGFSLS